MSGCPFDVGDCVQCVVSGPILLSDGTRATGGGKLRQGAIYRVERVAVNHFGRAAVWVADSHPIDGSAPVRFRKIDDGVTESFRHQMRSLGKRRLVLA